MAPGIDWWSPHAPGHPATAPTRQRAIDMVVDALLDEWSDTREVATAVVDLLRPAHVIEIGDAPIRCAGCGEALLGSGAGPLSTLIEIVVAHDCPAA